jgi:hypothetical protein
MTLDELRQWVIDATEDEPEVRSLLLPLVEAEIDALLLPLADT